MDLKYEDYLDPLQWDQDQSSDFTDGTAYWAKVPNAVIQFLFLPNATGETIFLLRVRTGGKTNPTEYIPSYKVEIDGVILPMALDPTRPNLYHDEFGESHIGWIKGVINIPNTSEKEFKFTSTREFGAIDGIQVFDPTHKQAKDEGYKQGLADGSKGMYTQAQLDQAKADAKAQGITEGKQTQRTADVKESQAKYKDVTVRQYAPLE